MRLLTLLVVMLFAMSLAGYCIAELIHEATHRLSTILHVHEHQHDHHHSIKDHKHISQSFTHDHDKSHQTIPLKLVVNLLSFLETQPSFTFNPSFLFTILYGNKETFPDDVMTKPNTPPPVITIQSLS